MPFHTHSIAKITGYSGANPTLAAPILFDNLSIPLNKSDRIVEAVERPGLPYHGLRIGPVKSTEIVANATLHTATVADGFTLRDTLRGLMPVAGSAYYGVWCVYSDIGAGPYDVLAVDLAQPFQRLLAVGGDLVVANPTVRFDFALRLRERSPGGTTP